MQNLNNNLDALWQKLAPHLPASLPQPMLQQVQSPSAQAQLWMLRDDYLHPLIHGPKLRKLFSIRQAMISKGNDSLVAIGGINSNNLVAIAQFFRQDDLLLRFLKKKPHTPDVRGNELLLRMLARPEEIMEVESSDWNMASARVEELADDLRGRGLNPLIIPEGSFMPEAIPGLLTLPIDIVGFEEAREFQFDHIFIDAGTGITAGALAYGLAHLGRFPSIHVTVIATRPNKITEPLLKVGQWVNDFAGENPPALPDIVIHASPPPGEYGAVNAAIIQKTIQIGQKYGLLTDPVYTTKHFISLESRLQEGIAGRCLFIMTGGLSGMIGFADQLGKASGFSGEGPQTPPHHQDRREPAEPHLSLRWVA